MFDVYTEQYIQVAVQIIRKRFYFMELLQKWAEPIHHGISRGIESLEIAYATLKEFDSGQTVEQMESIFGQKLLEVRRRELERGMTLVGPHRDDLHFL